MNIFRSLSLSAVLVAVLMTASQAATITIDQIDPGSTVPGYVSNDIKITLSGEWTGAQMLTGNLGAGTRGGHRSGPVRIGCRPHAG